MLWQLESTLEHCLHLNLNFMQLIFMHRYNSSRTHNINSYCLTRELFMHKMHVSYYKFKSIIEMHFCKVSARITFLHCQRKVTSNFTFTFYARRFVRCVYVYKYSNLTNMLITVKCNLTKSSCESNKQKII